MEKGHFDPHTLEKMIIFLADPLDQRSNEQFCTDLGISITTFYKYKQDHDKYIDEQVALRLPKYRAKLRQAGYKALGARMKKSDNAIKLLFQLLGDLVERTEQNVTYKTLEEKKAEIANRLKRLGIVIEDVDGSPKYIKQNKDLNKSEESLNKSSESNQK